MGSIIERGEPNKDKETEVYIDLGSQNDVYQGMKFDVYKYGEVAGRQTRSHVTELTVEEVLGKDISFCSVGYGKKQLKAALDAGERSW